MIVYRICKSDFKDDISGNGAKINGSRWNSKGVSMLYTAEHISLAALEMLVHLNFDEVPYTFHLLSIFIPDNLLTTEIKRNKLKSSWEDDVDYTIYMGNQFIQLKEAACLKVPSAVVSEEHNYLFNPLHPEFKKVYIQSAKPFHFDKRLFHL